MSRLVWAISGSDEVVLIRRWGEAPEPADYFRGGLDGCFRMDVARPIDAPSRGPALDHGSARLSS
jgi:hypothetical protein